MRVSKWVDFGQEVEVDIGMDDIRAAIAEASTCVEPNLDYQPRSSEIKSCINIIAQFFKALTDEHIALLEPAPRKLIRDFLAEQATRFELIP